MAFPANSVLDDFNRANTGPPPSASWDGPIWSGDPQLRVVSNTLRNDTTAGGANYWNSSFGADQEAYITVSTKPSNGSGMALYLRIASPNSGGFDAYEAGLNVVSGAGNDTFELFRVVNTVETSLGTRTQEVAAGDSFGVEAIGTTLQFYYKAGAGSWAAAGSSFTDSTITGSGFIGIGLGSASGSSCAMDNFGGGVVTSGPTVVTTSDTLAIGLSEDRIILGSLTRDETLALGLSDASSLRYLFNRDDTLRTVIDDVSSLCFGVATSDTLAIALAEASALSYLLNRDDTIVIGMTEDRAILARLSRDETLALGLVDDSRVLASMQREDGLAIVIVEASSIVDLLAGGGTLVQINTSDTLAIGLVEASAPLFVRIATDDALALAWSESIAVLASMTRADLFALGLTDESSVLGLLNRDDSSRLGLNDASGLLANFNRDDSMTLGLSENSGPLAVFINTGDTIPTVVNDASAVFARLSRDDQAGIVIVDSSRILIPITSADTLVIGITETGEAVEVFLHRFGNILLATVKRITGIGTVVRIAGSLSIHRTVAYRSGVKTARLV